MRPYNKTLTTTWENLGEIRNRIKEIVKEKMGWKSDPVFYDRVFGRAVCTPAEQNAFNEAFKDVSASFKEIINIKDLFPASDFTTETVE